MFDKNGKLRKFTFKTEEPTGRYRSFFKPTYHIKLKRKECGYIQPVKPHKIRLQVIKNDINEDGNPNCHWKWIQLKKESKTIQEAKEFLNQYRKEIFNKYNIYLEDNDA